MRTRRHTLAGTALVASVALALSLAVPVGLGTSGASPRTTGTSAGTITAVISSDPPSLDPARGFDSVSWSVIHATFVSLLSFNTAMHIIPWGAEALPVQSDNGKVYTFHLRPGLKFSDGEAVTAQDYAYAIERILNPATKSQLMAFYQIIDGATAYSNHKASSVSGIKVVNATTLQFTLTRADRTFLDIMAIPNASAVPPSVVAKDKGKFDLKPIGDGPFNVQTYIPGRELVLVKNPTYYAASKITTKEVKITIGLTPSVEALRVENGETDVMMDNIPTSVYIGLRGNSKFTNYLHHFISIEDNYVALNMKKKPFNNKLVREAAALSVNQSQVLRAISGMGTPLTQILAPGMPGYNPKVRPLGYKPAKARRLLKDAGHPGGKGLPTLTFAVATGGFTAGTNVAQVVQQDLQQVGFKVQLKAMAPGPFLSSLGHYPLTMGIYGLDYPDPSDLIASQFSCSEIAAGNNWQFYCNHAIDNQLNSALALPLNKAIPVYRSIQTKILKSFPWIPLYYQELWYIVNPKVKGFGANSLYPLLFANWKV